MPEAKKHILIAEDTEPIAQALQFKLAAHGYDAIAVGDGKEALDHLGQRTPDLIITDIIMPNIDGFGLLQEVKKNYPDIPVLIFSDLAQDEDKQRVTDLGASEYFVKSDTSLTDFVAIVDKYLKEGSLAKDTSQK